MGVGGTKGNSNEVRVYLKPQGFKQEDERTYFQITEFVDKKWQPTDECGWVTAHLDKIEIGKMISKKQKEYKTLNVELVEKTIGEDAKPNRFVISMFWGRGARELINRLITVAKKVDKFDEMVTIGVYNTGDKGEAKFLKGYWLKYGDSYDLKEQSSIDVSMPWKEAYENYTEKKVINQEEQRDYTKLDTLFTRALQEIIQPKLVKHDFVAPVKSPTEKVYEEAVPDDANDAPVPENEEAVDAGEAIFGGVDEAPLPSADDMPDDDLPF